jgi:phage shock protein A
LVKKQQHPLTLSTKMATKAELLLIKAHLRWTNLDITQCEELTIQLTLLDTFITDLKEQVKAVKENFKKCQVNLSEAKKNLLPAGKKGASWRQAYQLK